MMRAFGLRSEPMPVLARRDTRVSLEKAAEESHVLVADGVADLLHRAMVAFEHALGGGDAKLLQIKQRAVAGSFLEAAHEVAQAHTNAARGSFERKTFVKVLMQPLLGRRDI